MKPRLALCLALAALCPAVSSASASAFQARVHRTPLAGTRIAWYERGHGPPLLMLTGTGSTMAEWDPALLRALAPHHRLILFDYPGVGWSGPWRGRHVFDTLADSVGRFMSAIGVPKADVLGWSMGGFVAQRLAIDHPRRVSRLVLAGTNPGGGRSVLGTRRAQEIDSEPNPPLADILRELYPPHRQREGRRFLRRLESASQSGEIPNDFQVAAATTDAQVAAEDPWLRSNRNYRQLGALRVPTLAAAGREDPVVPPVNLRRIAARVPGARFHVFAGAHAFLFQQRQSFTRVLDAFLGCASAPAPLQPFAAQALGRRHFGLAGALLFRAGRLQGRRQPLEAGLGEEGGEAALPHLAFADVGVAVAAGAERGGGVVDVDGAEPPEPHLGVGFVQHRAEMGLVGDVVALDEEVAGVEAEAEPPAAAGQLDQLRGLVEVAAQEAFVAGGLLEQEAAAVAVLQRRGDHLPGPFHRGAVRLAFLRPGVQDDAGGADPVADPQRVGQRGERLLAQLLVFGRAVDQVDGVDDHRVDRGALHRLAEGGEIVLAVAGRPPHARALVEDLDRFAAAFLAALDRFGEPAGGGDVRSDQHSVTDTPSTT
jgi:pimeloyl-ACP methyl ester carboxylesterase